MQLKARHDSSQVLQRAAKKCVNVPFHARSVYISSSSDLEPTADLSPQEGTGVDRRGRG